MINHIKHENMGRSKIQWLDSIHHFSFSTYYNPDNVQFGALRVVNDDLVAPDSGFDTHSHNDMEILSYVVDGELTHADSMGNHHILTRGQVQYMSAGTGVQHSEYNYGQQLLRFLQIWISPDKMDYPPQYGDHRFAWEERIDNWLPLASGDGDSRFPIQIHADVHVYATFIPRNSSMAFTTAPGRQAYLVLIEGECHINNSITLAEKDALEITEDSISITTKGSAHILLIEMAKPLT